MPEFFLELFSEEAPAFPQASAAEQLCSLIERANTWTDVNATGTYYYTPRRMAVSLSVASEIPGKQIEARGPRENAPDAAISGFLKKAGALRKDLVIENGYFVLRKEERAQPIRQYLCENLPTWLSELTWPKAMRWGQSGQFSWIRPLRRILCLLDNEVLPIEFGPIIASRFTEGHRSMGRRLLEVSSVASWKQSLLENFVMADPAERRRTISNGLSQEAAQRGLTTMTDELLLEEVNNLVEWPVTLIGKIDKKFMDLPPEVRELSMKTNQKYFALRDAADNSAPYFGFIADLEAPDGGAAIIAGNERVLRARFSDAEHFWQIDLKTPLNELLPKLDKIIFHSDIGTQGERANNIASLAVRIAGLLGANKYEIAQAYWAGLLCKADLVTGMVGEFPELQGVMGGYYAEKNPQGWDGALVGAAIKTHYQPRGPGDGVPHGIVSVTVALADKLYSLMEFFRIGETPSGSGDPYALRRAALGVIRIILETQSTLPLKPLLKGDAALFDFIIARLRVKLRAEGKRFDIVDAVLSAGADDDLLQIMKKAEALDEMLGTVNGKNLLAAYKRAANILKIETARDGLKEYVADQTLFSMPEEHTLFQELTIVQKKTSQSILEQKYNAAMSEFAKLRGSIDTFFNVVTVNDNDAQIRGNRLALLSRFRNTVDQIADFSKLEG